MHTLLLADDSVTIQRVIELTFADEDVQVVAVSDGGEAIAMLGQTPPDIVLADVGMPGQNGYEVARHIRDTPGLAHIPIVLLTGAFEPIDQAKAADVGCDGVLAKPFEPQLVIAKVKELLARPRKVAAPASAGDEHEPAAAPAEAPTASQVELDSYFDRLDAAFSKVTGVETGVRPLSDPEEPPPMPALLANRVPARVEIAPKVEPALSPTAPDARFRRLAAAPPRAAAPPLRFPPLAEAFAALLAAEQSSPAPLSAPVWPETAGTPGLSLFEPPAAPALPDGFVDHVTQRVLDRLSDRVVRETTAEIVSAVAERLVKEEIDQIKRHIN